MSDLQQRMAEKIDGVIAVDCGHFNSEKDPNTPGGCKPCYETAKRIAERLMPVVREALGTSWSAGVTRALESEGYTNLALAQVYMDNPHRNDDE